MSYGLMPYAVDLSRIRALLGAGDEATLEAWSAALDAAPIDGLIQDRLEGGAAPGAQELLRHMLYGEPYDERLGPAYAYLFEHVCRHCGRLLDNRAWSPIRFSFFDEVGRALVTAGVPSAVFEPKRLISGPSPIRLPPIDDFPALGWLSPDEAAAASNALSTANFGAISDVFERQACEALSDWLAQCSTERNALVCFYY